MALLLAATFLMIHLVPGDPVRASLGPTAPKELVDARRHALGLDQSLPKQFADYVRQVASGDVQAKAEILKHREFQFWAEQTVSL